MKFIAEIGISHNGSTHVICRMLDMCRMMRCDFAKLQVYDTDRLFNKDFAYYGDSKRSMISVDDFNTVKRYADNINQPLFASVFHVDMVNMLDMDMFKVASVSVPQIDLLKEIAKTGKPVIMSTGKWEDEIVDKAVDILRNNELTLMYCVPKYPSVPSDYDMTRLDYLKNRYSLPVGISDHCMEYDVGIKAKELNVPYYEHHITLSRKDYPNCDSACSWEPNELSTFMRKT